jgi:hypothetical protein
VLCGSGQQHPFRAPQRVQRIAFEIVSSGQHVADAAGGSASVCGMPDLHKVPPATTTFAVTTPDKARTVRSRTQHHDRPSYAVMAFCQPVIALVAP